MHGDVIEIDCDDAGQAVNILRELNAFEEVAFYGSLIHVVTHNAEAHMGLIRQTLIDHGIGVTTVEPIAPSLEDVFISSARQAEKTLGVR